MTDEAREVPAAAMQADKKKGSRANKFKHSERLVVEAIRGAGKWLGEDGEPQGSGGIVTLICARLGISRATFYAYKARRPAVAEAYREEQESALDLAEQSLLRLVKTGDFKAVSFYLKCRGKGRGYLEKQESEAEPGRLPVLLVLPENFADAVAWEAFSKKARSLAGLEAGRSQTLDEATARRGGTGDGPDATRA